MDELFFTADCGCKVKYTGYITKHIKNKETKYSLAEWEGNLLPCNEHKKGIDAHE